MNRYRAVLFDLFGTVALLDRDKLPPFTWNGTTTRTTTGALRDLFESRVPDVPFADFVSALTDVTREQQAVRATDLREVACALRFNRTLQRAGLPASPSTADLAARLAHVPLDPAAHRRRGAAGARAAARSVCAPATGWRSSRTSTTRPSPANCCAPAPCSMPFTTSAISVDHGWRKPSPRIFADTLTALGIAAHEALFVGDSPEDDVAGAGRAGIDVAWVNASGSAVAGCHARTPTYVIPALPALEDAALACPRASPAVATVTARSQVARLHAASGVVSA